MRKISFALDELSDSDIEWLAKVGQTKSVSAGTVLIHARKPSDSVYIVLSGVLSITIEIREKHEVARFGYGEIIGEMSFLSTRSSSTTAEALEDSIVFAIPKSELAAKLDEDVEFAARFYRVAAITVSNRLRNTMVRLTHGESGKSSETVKREDGLDARVLDTLHAADFRIDRILKRLAGAESAMLEGAGK